MASYQDIARELEKRIRIGAYPANEALPPRSVLLKEFGVARATLDRAVGELLRSGLLTGRRGAGTFVMDCPRSEFRVALVGDATAGEYAGCRFKLVPMAAEAMSARSEWRRLLDFDGVIWMRPDPRLCEAAAWLRGRRPQVTVNRELPGIDGVLTDDRGAYRAITAERLTAHPDWEPVFLQWHEDRVPFLRRLDGFVDACREAGRFYECWRMPPGFDDRAAELRRRFAGLRRPAVVAADCRAQTGSFMRLAWERRWQFGRDAVYHDFDNHFEADFWGMEVTSFLQDFRLLLAVAADRLLELLEGRGEAAPAIRLIPPVRREGGT